MSLRETYNGLVVETGAMVKQVAEIWNNAGDEPLSGDLKKQVIDLNKKIEEKEVAAKELLEQLDMQEGSARREKEYKTPANGNGFSYGNGNGNGGGKGKREEAVATLGELFTGNKEFKDYLAHLMPNGNLSKGTRVHSPAVPVGSLKTLITGVSSTSAGAMVVNDRLSLIDAGTFGRPLTIRQLVTNGSTNSDTVEYVRQGTHTNNAATVAEATATSGSTGVKPESAMALSIVTETVKTIAHWVPATRRALADAGQLRTLIDNFLRYGLEEELEDQIINGDGVGENFTGILNTTGTATQAWDTDILTTTRKARTKVKTEGRAMATAYVLHPTDWETLDLTQDAEDRYYFGGPMVMGTPRLWGLPVVESEAIDAGVGIVADWRMAALWDREQANILVSDSHSDFFIRNLIAILAEMRAAFGVIRPKAFVEIDLTS